MGTVYAAILHEATNGDQIIRHKLNQSISWGGNPDQNAKDSYIAVDLTALVSKKPSAKDTCIVKDMIDNQTPATRHSALKSAKKVQFEGHQHDYCDGSGTRILHFLQKIWHI